MGQAVQTIQAANEGIEAITEFANQAKAIATSANDTSDGVSIKNYMSQFDEILKQIDGIAKDSGYKGVNLLEKDQELKVVFNEDRSSSLTVKSDDASSEGLGLKSASTTGSEWAKDVEQAGDVAEFAKKTQFAQNSFVYDGSGKVYKVATAIQNTNEDSIEALVEAGTLEETDFVLNDDKSKAVNVTINKEAINNSITQVEAAVSKLRNMASVFGNNYSIVEGREEFTENLINVLEEGADKLTLADMNEESANMLALQTRQQLAINSLSLASQAAQSVLSLF